MSLELRPTWCLTDERVGNFLELGPWVDATGALALDRDGDDWRPGRGLKLTRKVHVLVEPADLHRHLGLGRGASIGLAARWSCRSTAMAGTHQSGPSPLPLTETGTLVVDIPSTIGGRVDLETSLLVEWSLAELAADGCPDGAMIWSDGWAATPSSVLLEGDEARIRVRSVSFEEHFGRPSDALWSIDVDHSIDPGDSLANVVTVLLNSTVLDRDFEGEDGVGDASLLPAIVTSGIQVDLMRSLTTALYSQGDEQDEWSVLPEGSVGHTVNRLLIEAFGSLESALSDFEGDEPGFTRELQDWFSPETWRR